jgi:hypothetical protein
MWTSREESDKFNRLRKTVRNKIAQASDVLKNKTFCKLDLFPSSYKTKGTPTVFLKHQIKSKT